METVQELKKRIEEVKRQIKDFDKDLSPHYYFVTRGYRDYVSELESKLEKVKNGT